MKFASINGVTLYYQESGDVDKSPLVFINSLGSDHRIWGSVTSRFDADFYVIRYDKRGHGLSDCPDAPYTIRDHSSDLYGLLNYLELGKAILVGISVGGQIAMDFALTYPDFVDAMILCDTAPKIGTEEMWNQRINTLEKHGMAHLGGAILERWFAPSYAVEHAAAYRGYYNMLTRMPVEGYTGTCAAIRDFDARERIKNIDCEVLVVCGDQDLATTPEQGEALAQSLPRARFVAIEGAAHLPCIEQPEALAGTIRSFLERIRDVG